MTTAPAGRLEVDPEMFAGEAAIYLGRKIRKEPYAVRTIYNLRSMGQLPPDRRVRGRPVWLRSTLDRWADRQIQQGHALAAAR